MQCLVDREPLPPFILEYLEDEELAQRDFEAPFVSLLIRSCQLLSAHKAAGSMDDALAAHATRLLEDWSLWPSEPLEWPPTTPVRDMKNSDEIHHMVWLAVAHLTQQGVMIVISDLSLEYAHAQYTSTPSPSTSKSLERAVKDQFSLCNTLRASITYHMEDFAMCKAAAKTMGAQALLWPLSTLLGLKTTMREDCEWCVGQAVKIAEMFNLKHAKMMADMMAMAAMASPRRSTSLWFFGTGDL